MMASRAKGHNGWDCQCAASHLSAVVAIIMCGIAGLQNADRIGSADVMQNLLARLRHRGPDEVNAWVGDDWTVGATRLAIMDPMQGRQPMRSADGRWVLVFNGEIYNFRELRTDLSGEGILFRTSTDTEVLVELVASQGVVRALEQIEGMFAFAAVETASGDLWLGRDRIGEKPLYLDQRNPRQFAFCSEISALLEARDCARRLSGTGAVALLRYGNPWPGSTAIEGISELKPSQWLRRTRLGEETRGSYWHPPDRVDTEAGPLERCTHRTLELLDASVKQRLLADVPLGLFLSGGIDSGAIAASAVGVRPELQAVTIGFEEAAYDERPLARRISQHLGLRLEEERGIQGEFSAPACDELLRHYGQPFADTSAVPTRALARAGRRHFRVALSGDGGDELFSGYMAHARNRLLTRYGGGATGSGIAGLLATVVPERGSFEKLNRALKLNASRANGALPVALQGVFTDESVLQLVEGTDWYQPAREQFAAAKEQCRTLWNGVDDANLALSLHMLRHSLPQDILTKVDRMSMAESLEVRAPFLDSKLVSYALSLPAHLKINGSTGKYVLRQALRDRLPPAVLAAGKHGFNLPARSWLGQSFWRELGEEVELYARDDAAELNVTALRKRVQHDQNLCRTRNSYRALHRSFLLYGFLRWRRTLMQAGKNERVVSHAGVVL